MLIIGPSGLGKTNALINLIQKQDNGNLLDKIYLYANDLSEGIKNLDDPCVFIE